MLRIVSGQFGGRRIPAPEGRDTRPTSEKVRAALFNVLHHRLDWEGLIVLDLYAGSGALGIEALSRGARRALFVESHARTAALIRSTLKMLGLPLSQAEVVTARVEVWLRTAALTEAAGLVLMDPPYGQTGMEEVLQTVAQSPAVAPGAMVVLETGRDFPAHWPEPLESLESKRYGDTQVHFLMKRALPATPPEKAP
ncbi:MAG: 16S rRNA (guanine(966)-N(2))-methyltransferase RsmD [Deltaproteobacteria bacterium]|nr:16S rRNA (guanine(966)-N(2))-methyltransferase RsmD [Deltaproteobacteria bacterium]